MTLDFLLFFLDVNDELPSLNERRLFFIENNKHPQ